MADQEKSGIELYPVRPLDSWGVHNAIPHPQRSERRMNNPTVTPASVPPILARRPVSVLAVKTGDGLITKYATVLMPDHVQTKAGVRGEAVLGRFLDAEGPLAPVNFVQNRDFVRFLHDVIGRHAAACPALSAQAESVRNGHVYVLDGRRKPDGPLQPQDIVGTVAVVQGRVQGYQPGPVYRVFTEDGFMCLESWFHARLVDELMALPVAKISFEQAVD